MFVVIALINAIYSIFQIYFYIDIFLWFTSAKRMAAGICGNPNFFGSLIVTVLSIITTKFLIDKKENSEVRMHKPVKKELVLTADQDWEGNVCGYESLIKVGDKYRLYYRAQNYIFRPDGSAQGNKSCFCLAESSDLKKFKRMPINKYERDGVFKINKKTKTIIKKEINK